MTLCPIALVASCRKCPAFSICPLKGIIGDYKADVDPPASVEARPRASGAAKRGARKR